LRTERDSAATSPTSEADSAEHPPAEAVQDDVPLVSRTGAAAPATAGLPVVLPLVVPVALPVQAVSQSTLPPAVLDADRSPSSPSACEPLRAEQEPPFTEQSAVAAVVD
jgi:hypothetical protein